MSNCEPRPGPGCARHADALAALVDEAPPRRAGATCTDPAMQVATSVDEAPRRRAGDGAERHADARAARVDGASDTPDRRGLDAHLAGCEACRSLLADLREIRALAAALEPLEPPARVWRGVERRVAAEGWTLRGTVRRWFRWPFAAEGRTPRGAGGRRLRWSLGNATLAGAAVVIVLGVVFDGTRDRLPPSRTPAGGARATANGGPGAIERQYAAAIRDLEQVSNAGVPIPPAARAALTSNLALVDRAIAESRSAVAAAPDNEVARGHLRTGLARKLRLLRTGVALGLEPR